MILIFKFFILFFDLIFDFDFDQIFLILIFKKKKEKNMIWIWILMFLFFSRLIFFLNLLKSNTLKLYKRAYRRRLATDRHLEAYATGNDG